MKNMAGCKKWHPVIRVGVLAGILSVLAVTACPNPAESKVETARYAVRIEASTHGRVSSDKRTAEAGEIVTLIVLPNKQYMLDSIRASGISGVDTPVNSDGSTYTFTMPREDVTIFAVFIAADTPKYDISINPMENGVIDSSPTGSQYENQQVMLVANPEPGYIYRPGSLKVIGMDSGQDLALRQEENTCTVWIFEMPAEDIEVDADFIDEETELYNLRITQTANGTIECAQNNAVAGDTVILRLIPKDDYRYKTGSLTITPNAEDITALSESIDSVNGTWSFIMPDNDVHITALFEEIPRYAVIPASIDHGMITLEPGETARADTVLRVTLTIDDPENYRYVKDSIRIIRTDTGDSLDYEAEDDLSWSFTMPTAAVSIDAELELIPWFAIKIKGMGNGSLTVCGAETSGDNEVRARAGTAITLTAFPASGYKLAGGEPSVTPTGAVTLTKLNGESRWTFDMAEQDLEISIAFVELGPLEIYKGGARKGITVGELSDDKKYYGGSIEIEAEEPGHDGNQRAIKITHALNANGNTVQQSFGLFSDTEINLEGVAALSFWARANKQLNIRYVGFGDADPNKRVVYTGENFNQAIPITTEWKRYVVPVPSPMNGQKTGRVFMFNALLANGNYVCIDDIEFIETGITLSNITLPNSHDSFFYGTTDAAKMLKGVPVKLIYSCNDGTVATLQGAANSHTLKYNLNHWLEPFIEVNGNVDFHNGVITPYETTNTLTLSVNIAGNKSNPMSVKIIDGITLDDFEGWGGSTIPANPVAATGYVWHSSASGSIITKEYLSLVSNEIYSGLAAGSWRPAANAKNPQGGRNFEAKDLSAYNTLVFRIRVTAGTAAGSNYHKNIDLNFELKNGGILTNKTSGDFFSQQFTYNTDGWQEVKIKLSDFAYTGAVAGETPVLDLSAVSGYALSVVENQDVALRISLDDIVVVYEAY
jgi:hypothetical protein